MEPESAEYAYSPIPSVEMPVWLKIGLMIVIVGAGIHMPPIDPSHPTSIVPVIQWRASPTTPGLVVRVVRNLYLASYNEQEPFIDVLFGDFVGRIFASTFNVRDIREVRGHETITT